MLRAIRTDKPYKVSPAGRETFEGDSQRQGVRVLEQELQGDTEEVDQIGGDIDYETVAKDIRAVKHNKHYESIKD